LGLASQILKRPGPGLSAGEEEAAFFTALESTGSALLKEIPGLGPAGQARLLASFELGRRYSAFRSRGKSPESRTEKTNLTQLSKQALEKISIRFRTEPQEWLGFVPIYRTGNFGDLCLVEQGARTHVNVDPAELFARLLALRPFGFYLFHNHPSGHVIPSSQDLELTERVAQLSQTFGIQLLGHWIVSADSQYWIPGFEKAVIESK
jgi:DNA repair protein RadC